jgi:hypothetical protein
MSTAPKQTPERSKLRVGGLHAGREVNPLITENGFRVVVEQEVGHVAFDGNGPHEPHEAAFLIIANAGMDGVFRFPGPAEGVTVEVTVNTRDNAAK